MNILLSGDEAVAQAVAEAGVAVATAYPGTPSTEVLENILIRAPKTDATWCVNEKNAFEVAYGAAVAGMRSITAMKHVGLNVAADPLMTSAYTGINAGFVIAVADDPGMYSSQNEQDTRRYAFFAKMPMLEPSNSQETLDFTKLAFELSERFDIPVIIRLTTRVAHTKTAVTVNPATPFSGGFTFKKNPQKYVMIPAYALNRHYQLEATNEKLGAYSDALKLNRIERNKKSTMGIITAGVDYEYVREAFPEANILKIAMVNPLPKKLIAKFASSVKKLYVMESLEPFIEEQVRAMGIKLEPRLHSLVGELNVDILSVYKGKKAAVKKAAAPALPGRPPMLCKGCSHREVFDAIKNIGALVTGDIGCYTLGALPPFNTMDTCLCMGASVTMASGFNRVKKLAGSGEPVVAVLGDSTFIHTGIPGLIDAVYNKTNITVVILDNYVTAMTGHQPNPATGLTAKGEATERLDLEALVRGCGVKRVVKFNPYKEKNMEAIIKQEIEADEVSVILAEAPCIFYKKRFPEGVR